MIKSPTRSEKFTLLFLSATLLLGIGTAYFRKHHPPFSLKVISPSEIVRHEAAFETSKQVSLRRGDEEDFVRLPHVGPQLAKRIVVYREMHGFQRKEDILKVKGIGAKTYETLEKLLVLE